MKYFIISFCLSFIITFTITRLYVENKKLQQRIELLEEILLKVEDNKFIHETPLEITGVEIVK